MCTARYIHIYIKWNIYTEPIEIGSSYVANLLMQFRTEHALSLDSYCLDFEIWFLRFYCLRKRKLPHGIYPLFHFLQYNNNYIYIYTTCCNSVISDFKSFNGDVHKKKCMRRKFKNSIKTRKETPSRMRKLFVELVFILNTLYFSLSFLACLIVSFDDH